MPMILLPPSEGKTDASGKSVLDLSSLHFSELTPLREKSIAALIAMSRGSRPKARTALGLSVKQDFELDRNEDIWLAPVGVAHSVYTGVLFDAIGISSLTSAQLKKFESQAFVQSALFGLISVADKIPAYRLSGDTVMPKLASLTKHWSSACAEVLNRTGELIIDLRSGTYVKLGPLPVGSNAVVPKILQKMSSGPPKVITHHNKTTKGYVVRAMLESSKKVTTAGQFAEIVAGMGADVVLHEPVKPGSARILDVVVDVL